jgi:serine/threonine protein kinase
MTLIIIILIFGFKHIGELIDRGAFGAVYRGLDMKTGAIVAIKQVLLAGVPPKELQTIMVRL